MVAMMSSVQSQNLLYKIQIKCWARTTHLEQLREHHPDMFIAIIGTRCSGKSVVERYFVSLKGFIPVRILRHGVQDTVQTDAEFEILSSGEEAPSAAPDGVRSALLSTNNSRELISLPSPSPLSPPPSVSTEPLTFASPSELLLYVTRNWQQNLVTVDLCTRELVETFIRRPFFMLLSVDAPLLDRFRRWTGRHASSLEDFVREDDLIVFGPQSHSSHSTSIASLQSMSDLISVHVANSYRTESELYDHLDSLALPDPSHLRPAWDTYFMTLASLASLRSNCMKRRVGAVLVRENRVLATGYNGVPRGLLNCNAGGCPQCNGCSRRLDTPNECVCLHAEENALLEAGRERVGNNAVLYCNTCPCLRCTVKIIQTGVKTVVYNLTYKVDDASAILLKEAGVQLRRFDPSSKIRIPI